jgi:hypothetical protein
VELVAVDPLTPPERIQITIKRRRGAKVDGESGRDRQPLDDHQHGPEKIAQGGCDGAPVGDSGAAS